ncbi:MAG: zinc ribbon domain-containing protein [Victivallales bacterium]
MATMDFFIITAGALIVIFLLMKFLKSRPASPDPWENEIDRNELDKLKHEICLHCGAKVNKGQYYCPKCNNATGQYVPYLPFVNIPFNYSMHRTLWQKLKSKNTGIIYKITAILFIALTAPIMIIGFLVFIIFKSFRYLWKTK